MSPRRSPALLGLAASASLVIALVSLAPAAGGGVPTAAAAGSVTVAVIGDFGMANTAESDVARLVDSWGPAGVGPDAVIGTGDAYYSNAGGSGLGRYDRSIGKDWCRYLAGAVGGTHCPSGGTSTANRFWTAVGNHDYSDAGIDTFTSYLDYPGNERYFQVRIGPLDVFVIDSSAALWQGEMAVQQAWLESAARASTAPWQVVVLHHPPYSSSTAHGSSTQMRWPYAAWGIDLVLAGHDHTYERIARDGITYIVDGLGGGAIYGLGTPIEGTQARYAANHGALRLTASETTIEGSFASVDGAVRDAFRLTASTPAPTPTPAPTTAPTVITTRPAGFLKLLPKPGSLVGPGISTLSWRASARAVRYQVCLSARSGRCTTTWRPTTLTRLRVTLPRAATRYWQVRALGATGAITYANAGRWWRLSTRFR